MNVDELEKVALLTILCKFQRRGFRLLFVSTIEAESKFKDVFRFRFHRKNWMSVLVLSLVLDRSSRMNRSRIVGLIASESNKRVKKSTFGNRIFDEKWFIDDVVRDIPTIRIYNNPNGFVKTHHGGDIGDHGK